MKPVIVSFNELAYNLDLKSLEKNIEKIIKCLNSIEKITGKREIVSLESVTNFITDTTNFKNVFLSAELLEVADEYEYLCDKLDEINLDIVEWVGDDLVTKKEVIEKVFKSHTTYLADKFLSEYEILNKAVELLNKLERPSSVNCLKKDYENKFSVNVQRLSNSDRI